MAWLTGTGIKRRLGNWSLGVSTLLLVGFGAMWIRSAYVFEQWSLAFPEHAHAGGITRRNVSIVNNYGQFLVTVDRIEITDPSIVHFHATAYKWDYIALPANLGWEVRWRRLGIEIYAASSVLFGNRATTHTRALGLPAWLLMIVFGILPGRRWIRNRRRRRRQDVGRCGNCGYDLRASPGLCPECGAAAEGAPIK